MTGDQRQRNDITNGQKLTRHADRPSVFYFFPTAHFFKPFLKDSHRTASTFAFLPTLKAKQKNAKELALAYAPKPTHHPDTIRVDFKRKTGRQRY